MLQRWPDGQGERHVSLREEEARTEKVGPETQRRMVFCTFNNNNLRPQLHYSFIYRYRGQVDPSGLMPERNGVMYYLNGDRLMGRFAAGVPQGKGRLLYANGDEYQGMIANGKPEGKGSLALCNNF